MALYVAQPLLANPLFIILMALGGVAGGVYLLLEKSGVDSQGKFVMIKRIISIAMVVLALGFAWNYYPSQASESNDTIWHDYSAKTLLQSQAKPVILDFTAAWCQPCRQMERQTFPDSAVKNLLTHFFCVKVDVTNGAPNQDAQDFINKWRIRGVPTYMFLNPQGQVMREYTIVGFIDPVTFADHLQNVLDAIK
jgi:thiol:disulfide interchange protein DsbD